MPAKRCDVTLRESRIYAWLPCAAPLLFRICNLRDHHCKVKHDDALNHAQPQEMANDFVLLSAYKVRCARLDWVSQSSTTLHMRFSAPSHFTHTFAIRSRLVCFFSQVFLFLAGGAPCPPLLFRCESLTRLRISGTPISSSSVTSAESTSSSERSSSSTSCAFAVHCQLTVSANRRFTSM